METLHGTALVFGLFALRCLVPLVIMVGAGYLLARLDERWRAAAEAERQVWIEAEEGARQPAHPEVPYNIPLLPTAACWVLKGCDPAKRAECPAYRHPGTTCWLARLKAEGELPMSCRTCTLFAHDVGGGSLLAQEVGRGALLTQPGARD